jgi:predicted P-loop ATPase
LIALKNLPWRNVAPQTKDFTDDDEQCLAHYLEKMKVPFTQLSRGLAKIRNECKIHPVREYLSKLAWDGEERLDSWLIDYLGAEDSQYVRAVARKTLIGAVARIFEPGAKFDTVLTLIGKKGIYKSEIIKRLFGEWFSDTMGDIHDKSGMENLRGVWGMEIAELQAFNRADQEAIKRFITSREDIYRPAYGKQTVRFPRQCIFIATTNKFDFLSEADERRFLPVLCRVNEPAKDVWTALTPHETGQIWAEAVEAYRANESADLGAAVKQLAEKVREKHSAVDDREGLIESYLDTLLPDNWNALDVWQRREFLRGDDLTPIGTNRRTKVCAAEIWCEALGGTTKDMTTQNTKFIHGILQKMKGWEPAKSLRNFSVYGKQRAYEREENNVIHVRYQGEKRVTTITKNR